MKKKDSEKKSEKTSGKGKIVIKKSYIYFGILVALIIIALVLLILFTKYSSKGPMTVEDMHKALANGELSLDKGFFYNGFSFVYFNELWNTQIHTTDYKNIFDIQIRHSPLELQGIAVVGDPFNFLEEELKTRALYITFDPEEKNLSRIGLAAAELSQNLGNVFSVSAHAACTKNTTGVCQVRPTITCKDPYPTIYLKQADKTAIIRDKDCIMIQGDGEEIVKATERLLLGWYGVMPPNETIQQNS